MKNLILVIFSLVAFLGITQKPIKVEYVGISTAQVDMNSKQIIDDWETVNSCVYKVDRKWKNLSYVEKTPNGDVVKSWEYPIESSHEDEKAYNFYANETVIAIWKDGSMVSIQDKEEVYLVGAIVKSKIK